MTAIVAVQYKGGAAIGLDSATCWGPTSQRNGDKHIHRWDYGDSDLLIASAGHTAITELLNDWEPPQDADEHVISRSLREVVLDKDSYWMQLIGAEKDTGIEGEFVCALGDRVFSIGGNFAVITPMEPLDYVAGGCGEGFVLGSMWSTMGLFLDDEMGWLSRINLALGAAEEHCTEVRTPFHVVTTSGEEY